MTHQHKCPDPACGHVWEHRASDFATEDEYRVGHTCTKCGTEQYFKHHISSDDEFDDLMYALQRLANGEGI